MPHDRARLSMTVFSSFGTSFATWRKAGILRRELRYTRLLSEQLGQTALLTYDSADGKGSESGELAVVKGKGRFMPSAMYSVLAPFLHWRTLRRSAVFRSYQLRGAWTAALASMVHRKPFVLRTGYVWSQFRQASDGNSLRSRAALLLERFALSRANLLIAASDADRDLLVALHGVSEDRIHVIPNPVDVDLFQQGSARQTTVNTVTYVGRLESQKRVDLLIEAVRQVPGAKLRIIGDGNLRSKLEKQADGLDVEFTGTIPNEHLPALFSEATVFVLPSQFEGTPKSLLEAMASGCAVVATRVPGTEGVIADGATGIVVEPTPEHIACAIRELLSDASQRERLGTAAQGYVLQHHSMVIAAKREAALIRSLSPELSDYRAADPDLETVDSEHRSVDNVAWQTRTGVDSEQF